MNESIYWLPNPEWGQAQFVSITELINCEHKLNEANERILQLEQEINELRAEEARLLNTMNDVRAKAGLGFTKE